MVALQVPRCLGCLFGFFSAFASAAKVCWHFMSSATTLPTMQPWSLQAGFQFSVFLTRHMQISPDSAPLVEKRKRWRCWIIEDFYLFLGLADAGVDLAHWFCCFSYATTAATINSGALAGRVAFFPYLVLSAVMTGVLYPSLGLGLLSRSFVWKVF